MNSQQIRETFINFFKKKDHQFVSGCPIVPDNDPSLLFINAGMNQFKDVFLGTGTRAYSRAVNSQICVRVSGKHNDLEDVGRDSTHLTSFEMLGNWSFGDYYKKEAISWAWELFTTVFNIPKERLIATVFEEDTESLNLWKSETDINPDQIVTCDAKDNFWEMGSTGPCGPCSEIHVFLEDRPIDFPVNQDLLNSGQFIELWNLVFIQFNRESDGSLTPLPQKHVDTGAGLERIVAFLQNTPSNYQTDLFKPIITHIEYLSGIPYQETSLGMPHRVISDHIRTLCFGIADNVLLSNEGRGYVMRRLLRRACRYAKQLQFNSPILYKLVPFVVETLGPHFNQLKERQDYIVSVIKAEEESFLKTLSSGITLFDKKIMALQKLSRTTIDGDTAFQLYDTFGFPIDLTIVMANEKGFSVDLIAFEKKLEEQRQRSRDASHFSQQSTIINERVYPEEFSGLNLHLAEDLNVAKGGEARVITNSAEKLGMAQHHTVTHLLHEVLRQKLGTHVQQAGSFVDSSRLRFDFSHFESLSKEDCVQIETEVNSLISQQHPIHVSIMSLDKAKESGALALFGEKYDPEHVRVVNINNFSVELCAGTHVKHTGMIESFKIISESAIAAGTRRIEAIAGTAVVHNHLTYELHELLNKQKKKLFKCKETQQSKPQYDSIKKDLLSFEKLNLKKLNIPSLERQLKYLQRLDVQLLQLAKSWQKEQQSSTNSIILNLAKECIEESKGTIIAKYFKNLDASSLRLIADECTNYNAKYSVVLGSEYNEKSALLIKYGKSVNIRKPANEILKEITSIFGGGGGGRDTMAQAGGIMPDKLQESIDLAVSHLKQLEN